MIRLLIGQQGMAENIPKVLHILLCREDILPIEEFRYIRVEWMNEVEMMLKVFEKSLLFKCRYLYCRCRSSCRLSSTTTRYFERCGKLSNPKTFIVKSLELLLWLTQYLSFHPLGDFSIADKFHT